MAFNPIEWILSRISLDIGIDLGTANTLIYVKDKGIVINEPSWAAINKRTKEHYAFGAEAKAMVGRTPANIEVVRPLRHGVISNFEITQEMLDYFISKTQEQNFVPYPRPRVVIGLPSGVTEVERKAVTDAAMMAGARAAYPIEEPTASAIAVGLPIDKVGGSMIIDIGGGTSDVTVFSVGGIVTSRSLRVAGDELDKDILQYVRNKYNLLIGERMAEDIKVNIGSAFPLKEEKTYIVRGRNLVSGLPETIEISSVEVREALADSLKAVMDTIVDVIDEVPPAIITDLMDIGICLAGGGAELLGLAERISNEIKIPTWVAEDPMSCVARGAGMVLEDFDRLKGWLLPLE